MPRKHPRVRVERGLYRAIDHLRLLILEPIACRVLEHGEAGVERGRGLVAGSDDELVTPAPGLPDADRSESLPYDAPAAQRRRARPEDLAFAALLVDVN